MGVQEMAKSFGLGNDTLGGTAMAQLTLPAAGQAILPDGYQINCFGAYY